jgi:hypothetical protein
VELITVNVGQTVPLSRTCEVPVKLVPLIVITAPVDPQTLDSEARTGGFTTVMVLLFVPLQMLASVTVTV